jgi:hypothetical protein
MHAYEALMELVEAGLDTNGQAQALMDSLYDEWDNAWHEIGPLVNR